jgi:hypothetical protein
MSFTENQKTTLSSYFNNGMVGIGRNFQTQITTACAETGLTAKQVKVCFYFIHICGLSEYLNMKLVICKLVISVY